MLIEFTVANFLSFRDKKTISFNATAIKEYTDTNLIHDGKHTLLKGGVIYGANSSGKSNLIKAMSTMRRLVLQTFERSSTSELEVTPFLLQVENEELPSFFEVLFLVKGIRYRYGFEVTNQDVRAEWLFEAKKNSEKALFIREGDGIEVMKGFTEGRNLEEKTRDNVLFLSVVDQFNGKVAKSIMAWFDNFVTISGLSHERYTGVTFSLLDNDDTNQLLQDFYNTTDLGFDKVKIYKKEFDISGLPKDLPESIMQEVSTKLQGKMMVNARTLHKKYDNQNKVIGSVEFDMDSQESSGTNKVFNISGPVFDVLKDGGVLVIDELDASLHPLLTLAVTRLFNSRELNPKDAQLIFATHDTNLLSYGNYRRDQIYFVEKDQYGASDLYSLVEYKEDGTLKAIRKDRSFEKDYIQGRYGAIPFIGNLTNIAKEWQEK
ncbi:ATP/GTP-binding protein [Pedobacter sp. MC2016-24]|uniref:AAA family ATPase n=1 Tax=Pedobacter sp. MC2016-24 TaxID=2780090 RepID=UPI0018812359|nr:ATP-binding protein [Pedobacter sp. MC2016-24]MBE9600715.1 ATP-binding protein [Pedobacter sp. MC2016-24]